MRKQVKFKRRTHDRKHTKKTDTNKQQAAKRRGSEGDERRDEVKGMKIKQKKGEKRKHGEEGKLMIMEVEKSKEESGTKGVIKKRERERSGMK